MNKYKSKEEMKKEMEILLWQFIKKLNPGAREYFINEMNDIIDRWWVEQ